MPITVQPGCAATQAAARSQTSRWTAGSRTTPPLPTMRAAGLELRLDQRDKRRPLAGERKRRRQHRRQPDKARVADDEIDRFGDVLAAQSACVYPLANDDTRILAQFPGQLAMPDIDRINAPRTARQQHVGKAAGRCPDIERDPAARIDREMIERMGELDPAARYPGVVAPTHLDRGIIRQRFAGLVDPPLAGKHQTREDQRLRSGPAFGQAPLHQQLIGAMLGSQLCPVRRSAVR